MKLDVDLKGGFVNWRQGVGYDLDEQTPRSCFLGGQTPLVNFHLKRESPIMFRQSDGTLLMPAERFKSDGGSVKPPVATYWINAWRFKPGFLFHDSMYESGGLWVKKPGHLWEWVEVTRAEADALLLLFCICDPTPCGWWKSHIVWSGVRMGGWVHWGTKTTQPGSNPNEWDERPDVDPYGGYGGG